MYLFIAIISAIIHFKKWKGLNTFLCVTESSAPFSLAGWGLEVTSPGPVNSQCTFFVPPVCTLKNWIWSLCCCWLLSVKIHYTLMISRSADTLQDQHHPNALVVSYCAISELYILHNVKKSKQSKKYDNSINKTINPYCPAGHTVWPPEPSWGK